MPYFHVVFTLPAPIGAIAFHNKAVIYDPCSRRRPRRCSPSQATRSTWARGSPSPRCCAPGAPTMTHHPHVHMIVPGGGFSPDGERWIGRQVQLLPAGAGTLQAVPAADAGGARSARRNAGKLHLLRRPRASRQQQGLRRLPGAAGRTKWFVFCKRPFGGPRPVLAYLSRYARRVAISPTGSGARPMPTASPSRSKDYPVEGPGRSTPP